MRLELNIPDPIFEEAVRVASENGVSVELFITESVELRLDEEPHGLPVTPELLVSLRKAEADIDAGLGLTMAQSEEKFRARRAEWLRANPL
jgi:hypothetical protein